MISQIKLIYLVKSFLSIVPGKYLYSDRNEAQSTFIHHVFHVAGMMGVVTCMTSLNTMLNIPLGTEITSCLKRRLE